MDLCHICNGAYKDIIIPFPFFRHLDYSTISLSAKLKKCSKCMLIYNFDLSNLELDTYKTEKYANSNQTQQTMQIDCYQNPVSRSFLQAKILTEINSNYEYNRIMDIGCFDGKLLVELDRIIMNADLWGFDINPHLKSFFPQKENFHFISTDLKDQEEKFDLITLSHSIIYIQDLNELMASISRLLKEDGTLFIQIPDICSNPFYSLMGDQKFIFTKISLKNILNKYNYKVDVISNDYFPRELILIAKKVKSSSNSNFNADYLFEENINKINFFKKKLKNIKGNNIVLLGTTVNAAFVDEILGDRIKFFVDENVSRVGELFRGKNVIHPKNLSLKNNTILPFGKFGGKIKSRFEKLYKGSFTVV